MTNRGRVLAMVGIGVVAVLAVIAAVVLVMDGDDGDDSSTPADDPTAENGDDATPEDDEETPDETGQGDVAWDDCAFSEPQGAAVECGYLEVPENREDPDAGTVTLHFAVFEAQNSESEAPPLVYLSGGPGGAALQPVAQAFNLFFEPWTEERDLVVFDQRGTGFSEPSLACTEYDDLVRDSVDADVEPDEMGDMLVDALFDCRDRLTNEEGADLSAYNSVASAADMDELRQALGYEQWDVFGVSYGTRLALTAMREHPDGIRSAVLDSAYPLEADLYEATPGNVRRAYDVLFESCASDEACNERYPDLESTFEQTVEQLNEDPAPVEVPNPMSGSSREGLMRGEDLRGLVFQTLYATAILPILPGVISDAAEGEVGTAGLLEGVFLAELDLSNTGMQLSVQCHEEVPFGSADAVAAAAEEAGLASFFQEAPTLGPEIFDICAEWGAGEASEDANSPVESDIPALVLAGEFDPITPPSWGENVAENLSSSWFFEFPSTGHGAATSHGCAGDIMLEFLDDPATEPDGSCIEDIPDPVFTPDDVDLDMVEYTNESTGISGVRPEGWMEAQPGVFQESVLFTMVQQAIPGANAEQLLTTLAGQLGLDEPPPAEDSVETDAGTWDIYTVDYSGQTEAFAVLEGESQVYLVVVAVPATWSDVYIEEALMPAVEAFEVE